MRLNKTLRRLVEPGKLPYILLLLLAAASVWLGQNVLAAACALAVAVLLVANLLLASRRENALAAHIESRLYETENAKSSTLTNFPLPIAIFKLDVLFGAGIGIFSAHAGGWLLEGKTLYPTLLEINGRKYQLHGTLISSDQEEQDAGSVFMGITYWVDVTEYDDIRIAFENSRPVAGIIIIDNLDELVKNQSERVSTDLRNAVEDKLVHWCAEFQGILRRYDRDRYLLMMERQHLEKLKEGKFRITEEIHSVVSPTGITASISIGLGVDADSLAEAMQTAINAAELALSRGGDQTVVRNRVDFEFYGGRGSEVEKRTKVRSRVTANSFSHLIHESTGLLIMGHRNGDMDSYGAAVGVYSIARQRGLPAAIVADIQHSAAKPLADMMRTFPEYEDAFISPAELSGKIEPGTLLVVVDTNRPEQVEMPALLTQCERVAVIKTPPSATSSPMPPRHASW